MWTKTGNINFSVQSKDYDNGSPEIDLKGKSPVWNLIFFSDELLCQRISTIRMPKKIKNFLLCELRVVFGILILSGYHPLASCRHYWAQENDMQVTAVSDAMWKNRF